MGAQVVVEQAVAAEPKRVFAGWTSAEALARWWWPHLGDTTYEVDARDDVAGDGADLRQGWRDVLARLAETVRE